MFSYKLSFFLSFFLKILADLSREQVAIAKRYPAHTSLCIREGWEFCRPEHAAGMEIGFFYLLVIMLPIY